MRKGLVVLAVCAAVTVAGFAASGSEKSTTVGYFAVQVSKALGYKATTPQAAAAVIKQRSGIDLSADLGARLTEATAARVLNELGVKVNAGNPSGEISARKADQLATAVGLGASASVFPAQDLPEECLQEKNRGECVECCKEAVGSVTNPQGNLKDPGRICAKFCQAILPGPPSPSEPEP